jgi:O-antigen ligase
VTAVQLRTSHQPPAATVATASRLPDVVVVGSCLIAPLDLIIAGSFTVYDLVIGVAWLVLVRQGRLVWPHRGYLLAAYAFLLAALLSAFRALYAVEALTKVLQYTFAFFILVPAVITVVVTRRRAVLCVVLLCLGSLAAIAHAHLVGAEQGSGRVLVFYSDNPNRLGYPAAYLLPMLVALAVLSRRCSPVRRIGAVAAVALGCYLSVWAIFASGSRSSLVGAVVALLVLVVLRPGLGLRRAVARFALLCVALGGLGITLHATGQLPTTLEERITRSLDRSDPEAQSHLVADRQHLANAGLVAFVESPLLGTGLDNFQYVTPRYSLEASQQLPHNLWLQLLVQVGVFGTLAMAGFFVVWTADVVGAMRRLHPSDAMVLWALAAALAGLLTIFFFSPEMVDRHYWLIIALGIAIVRGSEAVGARKGTPA